MSQVPFFSFIEEIFLGSKCSYLIWLLKHQEKCTIREAGWNGDGFLSGSLTRICVCVTLIHIHVQSSCCSGNRCANSENEQQVDSTGTFSPITVIVYFYFSSTHTNSPMPCSLTLLAALFSFFMPWCQKLIEPALLLCSIIPAPLPLVNCSCCWPTFSFSPSRDSYTDKITYFLCFEELLLKSQANLIYTSLHSMQVLFEQQHSITQSVPGTMLEGWAGWYDLSKLNTFMLKSWDWGETAGGPAENAAHSKAGTVESNIFSPVQLMLWKLQFLHTFLSSQGIFFAKLSLTSSMSSVV